MSRYGGKSIVRLILLVILGIALIDAWYLYGYFKDMRLRSRHGFTVQTEQSISDHSKYIVFRPHVPPPEDGYPVILFLNGQGENGHDGANQLSNNFGRDVWEIKRRFPFICLAIQCRMNGSWDPGSVDTQRALNILNQVIEDYNADPDRIYLTGPSTGGYGVWRIAKAYPNLFAAIVPVSAPRCGDDLNEVVDSFVESGTAIWSTYNGGDSPGLVSFNRRLRATFFDAGSAPLFFEFNREGHDAWLPTYGNPALYDWLLRQSRDNNEIQRQIRFFNLLDPDLSKWATQDSSHWSVIRDDDNRLILEHLSESREEQSTLNSQLSDELFLESASRDFEFHFDYKSDGSTPCVLALRGANSEPASVPSEIWVVIERPERASGGVFDPKTGKWLVSANPIGQRSFRTSSWNNVRIKRVGNALSVYLNGWPLLSLQHDLEEHLRLGFRITPGSQTKQLWRYICLADLTGIRSTSRESSLWR